MVKKILREFLLLVIVPLVLAFLICSFMVPHPISVSIDSVLLLPEGKSRLLGASEKEGVTYIFFSGEFWRRIVTGEFKSAFTIHSRSGIIVLERHEATEIEGVELQQLLEQDKAIYLQVVRDAKGEVFAVFSYFIFILAVPTRIGVYFVKRRRNKMVVAVH